jgi:serine protease
VKQSRPNTISRSVVVISSAVAVAMTVAMLAHTSAQEPDLVRSEADSSRLAAYATAVEHQLPYIPGELLVRFRDGVDSARQQSVLRALRADLSQSRGRWIGETLLVTGLPDNDSEHAATILSEQPEVIFAQANYIQRLHAVPNDTLYSRQWNMGQINMPVAWDINTAAGRGVTVAVLDSGITTFDATLNFRLPVPPSGRTFAIFPVPFAKTPDFDFSRILPAVEFTLTGPWTASGQRIVFAGNEHGTHVAGTIAQQTNNNFGFAGVANGATLMPVKVCFDTVDLVMWWGSNLVFPGTLDGGCVTSDVIAGIHYAVDNGAKVLNLSLGGISPSPAYRDALNYAVSKGSFVAISAGNDALDGNRPSYPAVYATEIAGVVAVGATAPSRARASYSNFGTYVELAAPGGQCDGSDDRIWQIAPDESALTVVPPRLDRYIGLGICGTSMASPHVAAAAALLYSQGITKPAAIEAALEQYAVDLGTPGRDPQFGYGLIDVRAALRAAGVK